MHDNDRNIYKTARAAAGITQERAAELLALSVESVRAYELGLRIPCEEVVIRMADVYGTQFLAYQHLRHSVESARAVLPEIVQRDLPSAILCLQKAVNNFLCCRDDMIDITCDGVITEEERPAWNKILAELEDVCRAIMALKYAREVT